MSRDRLATAHAVLTLVLDQVLMPEFVSPEEFDERLDRAVIDVADLLDPAEKFDAEV